MKKSGITGKQSEYVLNALSQSVIITDADGIITYWNKYSEQQFGWMADEVTGMNIIAILAPADSRYDSAHTSELLKNPANFKNTFTAKHKDGSTFSLKVECNPMSDKKKVSGYLLLPVKLNQENDNESSDNIELFRSLSEAAFECIFLSEGGLCTGQNLMGEMTFGYTNKEAIGRSGTDWIVPEDRDIVAKNMKSGYEKPYEVTALRKDGSTFPCVIRGKTQIIQGKQLRVTSLIDISDTKEANKEKLIKESYLTAIIENQPGLLWLKDVNGKILAINNEFLRFCNLSSADDAIGKKDSDLWDKETAEKFSADDRKVIESRQSLTVEESVFVNGQKLWYETFKKAILDEKGNVIGTTGYSRDITERKQADEALRKSEARYKAVSHSASDAIITTDSKGVIVDWNKSAEVIFGYSEDEITGKPLTMLMDGKYHSHHTNGFNPSENSNVIGKIVEVSGKRKNGEIFPMDLSISKWETSEGSFYTGIIRDVTEKHTVQTELVNSRQFLERIINTLSEPVFVKDINHKYVMMNSKLCEFMGYKKEELIGKGDSDFFPKEQVDVFIAKDNEVFKTEQDNINEEYFTNADGKMMTIVTKKSVFKRTSGEKFIVGIINDITDIKANQLALEESERLLRESQKVAGLGNYETDFKTLIWKSSEVLDEIFGIDSSFKHSIENWVSIMHPDYREIMNDYIFTVLQNRTKFDKEYKFIRQNDGEVRWAHGLGVIKYDAGNNPVKLVGTVQDITERKKMEEALITAKETAEASDKLKTAFLNNISHEIRTPLNGILGFGELVTRQGITHENKLKFLGHLQKSTKRLMHTVTDYMDISLIVSGSMQNNTEEVNLSGLITKISGEFYDVAKLKGLQFYLSFSKSCENIIIKSDPELIEKVLYQLLNNAFKYTSKGEISISLDKTPESVTITVRDTGIGISKDSQKYIFDYFRQESEGMGRFYEGNGLGLSIAKGITELLGGEISIVSEKEEGSVFSVLLPCTETVNTGVAKNDTASNHSRFPNLLIVEDDESNMYLLEMLYKDNNKVKLYKATDGQEAISMCMKNPEINIVLMDLKLPGIDGYKATGMIKTHNPDVKVIALTAYAMSGDEKKALDVGCDDYIPKPVNMEILTEKIRHQGFDI